MGNWWLAFFPTADKGFMFRANDRGGAHDEAHRRNGTDFSQATPYVGVIRLTAEQAIEFGAPFDEVSDD